jgi:hypothetical protein
VKGLFTHRTIQFSMSIGCFQPENLNLRIEGTRRLLAFFRSSKLF